MTDPGIEISTDRSRLDVSAVHAFLTTSYWAKGRTLDEVRTTIAHSVPFGMYLGERQIGFARVLSDRVAFAYLMDVFVIPTERNRGYGTRLVQAILSDQQFDGVQTWLLKSRDARTVYERLGFQTVDDPAGMMVLQRRA